MKFNPSPNTSFLVILLLVLTVPTATTITPMYTWMTVHNPALRDESLAKEALIRLKGLGVTKVFVDVWNNGRLYTKSGIYNQMMGISVNPNPDYLSNVIRAAQSIGGIEVAAWFEYGLIGCFLSEPCQYGDRARQFGWELGTSGEYTWLDPGNSHFRAFFSSMLHEVKLAYYKEFSSFKGVQVDDHFAVPTDLTSDSEDVSVLAHYIADLLGREYLSISPAPMPFAKEKLNADWPTWMNLGYFYEVILQVYTESTSSFVSELNLQLEYYGNLAKIGAGIRCAGTGVHTPVYAIKDQIAYAESVGVKATAIWDEWCLMKDF